MLGKNGVDQRQDVAIWGEHYLIRFTGLLVSPLEFVDELLLVNDQGEDFNQFSFNPNNQVNSISRAYFTVLSDSFAVAVATEEMPTLVRFDQTGNQLNTRSLAPGSTYPSVRAAGDSLLYLTEEGTTAGGKRIITVRALRPDFTDVYTMEVATENDVYFNAASTDASGAYYLVYWEYDPEAQAGIGYRALKIDDLGEVVWERQIADPVRSGGIHQGYLAILPVGESGVTVLEGLEFSATGCIGNFCESEFGRLRIYPDRDGPAEVYDLNFSPFGMELLPGGEPFVYGTTSYYSDGGKGVLFKPGGWPDGTEVHLLEFPDTAEYGPASNNSIFGMSVAENGDLVGIGGVKLGDGSDIDNDNQQWFFRLRANGCFAADCSDLAENPGDLVPVNDYMTDASFTIAPNPAGAHFRLLGLEAPAEYRIISPMGQTMGMGTATEGTEVRLAAVPPGVYLLLLTRNGRVVGRQKLLRI
ncbi:T9SS type A sorting domain-containing protein [Neolewinella lacunae]|uniref:T9SS type A sorting domain-containing protein n=1 Tax=Neolewinella lacunae TaxID=1517758 RepID=A0A923PI23_9BACT|nr:T9SS type A sorting domain-containing protein [Neolewinella lacunae]MBC6994523.1 T9SS type A sorting domain-containing protein [Neolewinella lacunae]MDN3634216.1 T9SS type A sorting domain-containing protein [Neolewinella lacunae]